MTQVNICPCVLQATVLSCLLEAMNEQNNVTDVDFSKAGRGR